MSHGRWIAVAAGFCGVLVVMRAGIAEIGVGALFAIAAGAIHAVYLLNTRQLAGRTPSLVTLRYTSLVSLIVMSATVVPIWVPPSPGDIGLMALMEGLAAIGHFLVIKAFDDASSSTLAPLGYSDIVMATVVGFLWFGDFPDLWTLIGVLVIIASGAYVTLQENQARTLIARS